MPGVGRMGLEPWEASEGKLFQLLTENLNEYAVFVIDLKGHIRTWNVGAERLLGFPDNEILGQAVGVLYEEGDIRAGAPQREMSEALSGKRDVDERWQVRKDGSRFWSGGTLTPLRDEHGGVRAFAKVMRDRTDGKLTSDAALEQAQLAAFNRDIGFALVQADSLPEMLRHCAEAMVLHLAGAFARIWTLNQTENVLVLQASAGMYTHLDGPHSRVPVGKYKIGLIALERAPHLTNSVIGDPRVSDQEWAEREGMVAFAGYPLIVDEQVVGVMAIFARHPMSEATLEAMASVANAVAVGINRKTADDERKRQQELLAVTLSSIGDAVIATDSSGSVTFLNEVAQELTGWDQRDAQGRPLDDVFHILHEETRQPVDSPVAKVLQSGLIVGLGNHTILVARNGHLSPIDDSAAPIRDSNGNMIGVVLVFRDVTEQRRNEYEVSQSEARKAAIIETALDCIITIDHNGGVVEFNPAAENTFGYRREEIIGKPLADFIIPPALREQHWQGLARYLATGEGPILGKRLELLALHADGTEFPVELAISCISTAGPPLFTAYLRDLSEQMRITQNRNVRIAVTQALSEAASVKDGAIGLLRAVCENLTWEVGFVWKIDQSALALVCVAGWHSPNVGVTQFEQDSRDRKFAKGEGLPGAVWSTGKPRWLFDVKAEPTFSRATAAAQHDLHSAFACPVIVGHRTLGVIEFFTRRIHPPDDHLLEMMGTITGTFGQFLERETAAEQVRQNEHELADFFDNATVGLHWVGPDGTILRANRAELELLGYNQEEYVGRHIAEFHADEDVICDILSRLQAGEQLHEYPARLRCKDGSIKEVLIDSSVMFRDGMFAHTRCFTRDVTERKLSEEALRQSEQRARFLAEASAALALLVDFDSTLQKVASLAVPSFADWATLDLVEADGSLRRVSVSHIDPAKVQLAHEVHRRFPPDPDAPQGVWNILRTGRPEIIPEITDELLMLSANDDELLSIMRRLGLKSYIGVPLIVRGKTLGVITFVNAESGHRYDQTDLAVAADLASRAAVAIENSQLYRELREADRQKDEFLATLAHELRNPLAPIRNGLQVLRLADAGSAIGEEARSMMERQVSQMVRLVDDLLDISRITRDKIELRKERVPLASVVHNAVETSRPLIEEGGHTFSLTLPAEPVYVDADPTRLAQVFSNLLNNAAKYTEPGGEIALVAELNDGEAILRVKDNGLGIPAEAMPTLFEMFSQVEHNMERAQGGLGIGLTLVRRLVEMHGGTVTAHSDGAGRGSEFVVSLPIHKPPCRRLLASENDKLTATTHRRILVVDDNRDSATSLAMMLKLLGSEVSMAHDGVEAVEAAEQVRPDVILLDIGLPKLNGYEVCRRIREQAWSSGMVIIALTGWGQEEDRRRSAEAGFDHHLVKPVELNALAQLLDHH